MTSPDDQRPIANPQVVLREEFDDWAILFDPDTGNTFSLNPIGVLIWKQLDGTRTIDGIVGQVREAADAVPADVSSHVRNFIQNAVAFGLAGYRESRG